MKTETTTNGTLPTDTDALEQRADVTRERLFTLVDALDKKRHKLQKPMEVAGRVAAPLLAGAAMAAGVATVAFMHSRKKRERAPWLRFGRSEPKPSFWAQVARQVGVSLVAYALSEVGKRAVERVVQSSSEKKALLPGEGQGS